MKSPLPLPSYDILSIDHFERELLFKFIFPQQLVKGYVILWDRNFIENKLISFLCMFAILADYLISPIRLQLSYILFLQSQFSLDLYEKTFSLLF